MYISNHIIEHLPPTTLVLCPKYLAVPNLNSSLVYLDYPLVLLVLWNAVPGHLKMKKKGCQHTKI